jgi:cytosine/adenosine deaminase-related metal-dependent hydrolase
VSLDFLSRANLARAALRPGNARSRKPTMTHDAAPRTFHVGRLLERPGEAPCRRDAVVQVADRRIAAIGAGARPDDGRVILPALVNAHDHGRGLRHLAYGAANQALELWRPALYAHPPLDPYLNAALAFSRLAQAGFGSVVHVHSSVDVDRLADEAEAVCRAARDVGIRLAFVVPLRDQRTMTLADDDAFVALHEPADRDFIRRTFLRPFPPPQVYVDLVREIAARCEGGLITVQYGPNSPQACSDALLEATAAASAEDGRRIHTHLLETRYQRQWAEAAYPNGHLRHLDDLGLLSPRFTGAHGVWLDDADCALLAARGAAIAINTSSNLRLRSGIAPVDAFLRHGVHFAMGIDSAALDDDDDGWRDLRLTQHLHNLPGRAPALTTAAAFRAATTGGFVVANNVAAPPGLEPGAPADFVSLDFAAMASDAIDGLVDEAALVLARATKAHVRELVVAGRTVVADGRVLGIDLPAIAAEVGAAAKAARDRMLAIQPFLKRHQAVIAAFLDRDGHRAAPSG